jgi:hypothetical protein
MSADVRKGMPNPLLDRAALRARFFEQFAKRANGAWLVISAPPQGPRVLHHRPWRDTAGAETLRRMLTDWLTDMELRPACEVALLDRYIGYYQPYSTSDLDADQALFQGGGQCGTRATPRRRVVPCREMVTGQRTDRSASKIEMTASRAQSFLLPTSF